MIKTESLQFNYPGGSEMNFPDVTATREKPLLILGDSGCGKSTFLHLLAGLLKPQAGQIWIDDQEISKMSRSSMDSFRGQNIGLVYQKAYFIQSLNLMDNLMLSPFTSDKKRARDLAAELGIEHLLNKMPYQVSVGEAQRATIARAILHEPKVLLADEPTSALDNTNCEIVIKLLKSQARKHNAALIIVTHDERLKAHVDDVINLQSMTKPSVL